MINIDKYRVAANITGHHVISKLIFLRIIIPKFMLEKKVCLIIEFLRFLQGIKISIGQF